MADVVQLIGVIVSFLVIVNSIVTQIREWREGSPELRTLNKVLDTMLNEHTSLLKNILDKL
jgi:hypothetical protein